VLGMRGARAHGVAVTHPRGRRADQHFSLDWLTSTCRMTVTADARRTSGPEQTGPEGHGGQPPRIFGDRTRYYTKRGHESSPRSRSLLGRPSGHSASPRSEQSGHRNALSPPQGVSPGQRAGSRSCIAHASRFSSHPANAGKAERQAGYQTQQYRGLVEGRAVVPTRGMTGGMGEVRP
jgi:hypothetical protein